MKNLFLVSLLCLSYGHNTAQSFYANFTDTEFGPCPFNPNFFVTQPKDWLIYQTTNNTWDGPVDSSRCIQGTVENGRFIIPLVQIDPTEPLYIRYTNLDSLTMPMPPNELFYGGFYSNIEPSIDSLQTGGDCYENLCNGIFFGINIPNETFSGKTTRFQDVQLKNTITGDDNTLIGHGCFPSEYFQDQYLNTVVIKFLFDSTESLVGKTLGLYYLEVSPLQSWNGLGTIFGDVPVPATFLNTDGEYNVNISDIVQETWNTNYLVLHNENTYPSPANPTYAYVFPDPNELIQRTINIRVEEFQTLEFQPFTQFKGGKVFNNDTLRHVVNLEINGGDLCLNFIDLIFEGGDEFRFDGGHAIFNSFHSCMQFRTGSSLHVLEGKTMHYGDNGMGMLALCAGGTIRLDRDATLIMDGRLNLAECNDAIQPQHLYMDLLPGARLIFTEQAHITNQFSQGQQMKLYVRMLGGTLDDQALDTHERSLIIRQYPEPRDNMLDNIEVAPNPFGASTQLTYIGAPNEGSLTISWLDPLGRLVSQNQFTTATGLNTWDLEPGLPNGLWLLRIESSHGSATLKVVCFN